MKKILIDTNIVLDFALRREPFGEQAKDLILSFGNRNLKVYITASSVTDIYYILNKIKGQEFAINFLKNFISIVRVAGVDEEIITEALNSKMKDFEDAVQTETANFNDIDIIIIRDKKDYQNSGLQVFSPTEFINELKNK